MNGDSVMTTFRGLGGSLEARRRLGAYAEAVVGEYPGIPLPVLLTWSIAPLDAMAMWALLDAVDEEAIALDVGTFVGVSAFILASHPLVHKVISIDPNPLVIDEVNEKTEALGAWIDPEAMPESLRVHDVTRLALEQFPAELMKVQLFEGYLAPGEGSVAGIGDPKRFDLEKLADRKVVVFIDALHTADGVFGDLTTLFTAIPSALAVLDDCRRYWGPYVQSGVAHFLEEHSGYTFDLLADLCPGLATSNLGLVYPQGGSVDRSVKEFALAFDRTVDAIIMLEREEFLTDQVAALSKEVSDLKGAIQRTRDELDIAKDRAVDAEADLRGTATELALAHDRERLALSELTEMRQSTSWRLTGLFRRAGDLLRHRQPQGGPQIQSAPKHP